MKTQGQQEEERKGHTGGLVGLSAHLQERRDKLLNHNMVLVIFESVHSVERLVHHSLS